MTEGSEQGHVDGARTVSYIYDSTCEHSLEGRAAMGLNGHIVGRGVKTQSARQAIEALPVLEKTSVEGPHYIRRVMALDGSTNPVYRGCWLLQQARQSCRKSPISVAGDLVLRAPRLDGSRRHPYTAL